jgi:transposase
VVNDTTRLLGLAGLVVTEVIEGEDGPVVHLETGDERARRCPECEQVAGRVKEWVTTRPRDLPVGGRATELWWRKRRWFCDNPVCGRGTFTERVEQVPAGARLTARLREAAGAALADGGRTVVQSARDHGVSWPVVQAAFIAHRVRVLPAQVPRTERLGIDETRRGRPRWRWEEQTASWETVCDRWHVGFVDLAGGQGLLGQVEGRTKQSVIDWLDSRGQEWKKNVKTVAIDMCSIFKAAIAQALPHAVIVADHFHIVQLANRVVTEVRRRLTLQVRGRRGRKGNREWELRNRLTRSAQRMHADHLDPMVDDLHSLPKRIGKPILAAWNAKEDLLDLLALTRTQPVRSVIADRLTRFYLRCADSGIPEVERLASTISTWWSEILAFILTGITNAGSEGTNRVIKTIGRDAYGFRNPENQRLRTRCATTRKARGYLNPA